MSTLGQDLAKIYARELDRLADEVAAYENDSDLWSTSTSGAQKNAPGNLALHTGGTLMHFIGAGLGESGYVRDRDLEFSERDLPRAEVVRRINECRDTVVPVLDGLEDVGLGNTYPAEVPARLQGITTRALLLHLLWHVGWHLGHVYYHRLGLIGSGSA